MRLIGYTLSLLGIILLISSRYLQRLNIPFKEKDILIASFILIIMGILVIITKKRRPMQEKEEVPIYKGKKIIGYRKE